MLSLDQLAILTLGVGGVALSQSSRTAAYGCVVSLLAQPFWFYATWQAQQLGAFAACFAYTLAWAVGLRTYRAELATSLAALRLSAVALWRKHRQKLSAKYRAAQLAQWLAVVLRGIAQ